MSSIFGKELSCFLKRRTSKSFSAGEDHAQVLIDGTRFAGGLIIATVDSKSGIHTRHNQLPSLCKAVERASALRVALSYGDEFDFVVGMTVRVHKRRLSVKNVTLTTRPS